MSYFNNLSRNQKLAPLVGLFVIGTALTLASLPYNKTLVAEVNLPEGVAINLPCASAVIMSGNKTKITAHLEGNGLARATLFIDQGQLKLRHWGMLRHITCGLTIELAGGDLIKLPASLPFAAQNGVRPLPLGGQAWRTFAR